VHIYLTHPQVAIDPAVPVPQWSLSELGAARMRSLAREPWLCGFRRIVASEELKAREAAALLAEALSVAPESVEGLHENDRSSTGFLPPAEFERVADAFFASPTTSVRGWETAVAAQRRIVQAVEAVLAAGPSSPTIFVGHGGVGTLLKCHCAGLPIERAHDQPAGGGNHFGFTLAPRRIVYDWRPLEMAPPEIHRS
jgi:broad specificity phosphatase PhoE